MPKPSDAMINGVRYSHSNYSIRLYGQLLKGIKQIDWGYTIDGAKVMGTAREAIAETEGTVEYECSATMYRAEYDYLAETSAAAGRPLADREGDVMINYAARGQPSKYVHVRVRGLKEAKASSSAGADATETPVVFRVAFIKENGRAVIANSIY